MSFLYPVPCGGVADDGCRLPTTWDQGFDLPMTANERGTRGVSSPAPLMALPTYRVYHECGAQEFRTSAYVRIARRSERSVRVENVSPRGFALSSQIPGAKESKVILSTLSGQDLSELRWLRSLAAIGKRATVGRELP